MRVFVTGARGFVGARLCARLAAAGDELPGSERRVDVTDPRALELAVADARPDAVVHLAARSSVADSFHAPDAAFRVNFLGTRFLLDAVQRRAPRARVLLVSSGQVYGAARPGEAPACEASPLRPHSPYAWTKAGADLLGRAFAERGLDVVRARPFNHTGPGRPDVFVESSLARQIAERELGRAAGPLAVGNLAAVRDFLDVEDVVDAYLRLLDPAVPAGVYNVASGVGRRVDELFAALLGMSDVQCEARVDERLWRPTDVCVGSAQRLREVTGWAPRIALEETLARLLADWRQRLRAA